MISIAEHKTIKNNLDAHIDRLKENVDYLKAQLASENEALATMTINYTTTRDEYAAKREEWAQSLQDAEERRYARTRHSHPRSHEAGSCHTALPHSYGRPAGPWY